MRAWKPASRAAIALVVLGIALALPSVLLAADGTTDPATTTAPQTTTTAPAPPTTTTTPAPPPTTTTTTTTPVTTTTTTTAAPPPAPVATSVALKSDQSVSIVDGASNSDYGYSPSALTITAGDTVTWTNNGTVPEGHTVTGDGFDSGTLSNGETYSHTFTSTGTFSYVCTLHPFMKGSVTVDAAPPPPDNGSGGGPSNSNPSGGSPGSGSPDSTSDGTSPTGGTSPTTTGPGSESFGVNSLGAAGDGSSLPTTGSSTWLLGTFGALLMAAGLGLAVRPRARVRIHV